MIRDSNVKQGLGQQWAALRKLTTYGHSRMIPGAGMMVQLDRPDEAYNLPFVLAYAVLDQVLDQLVREGTVACDPDDTDSWMLEHKMKASEESGVRWHAYNVVDAGRNARNALAHEAILLSKADCLGFIDAIERELKAWAII